ncbi:hypothetical protein F5887DRAFT_1228507 [Amanita rubescens]|nr:hypothetical protein F5887DRAFT_1228507 [Amanita rubescens]
MSDLPRWYNIIAADHTFDVLLFAGNMFNLFLYGALTVQLYLYHIYFPKDPRLLKTVVYLVYVIETVHTILLLYDLGNYIFTFLAGNYPFYLLTKIVIPGCGAIVEFLTQAVYAHRIRALGKVKYIPWCIMVLLSLELIVVIIVTVIYTKAVIEWTSISLVIDVIIAIAMVWSLKRNKIFSKQLRSKVTRLVYLIIGTGTLTGIFTTFSQSIITSKWGQSAIVNLITVILFTARILGDASAVYGPAIVLSKLYANSMMVFLNDRAPAFRGFDSDATLDVVTVPFGPLHFETATGPADSNQEQPSLEGRDDIGSSA